MDKNAYQSPETHSVAPARRRRLPMDASLESVGLWVGVVSILVAYMVPALPYWAWMALVAVGGLSIAYIVFLAVARLRGALRAAGSKKPADDAG